MDERGLARRQITRFRRTARRRNVAGSPAWWVALATCAFSLAFTQQLLPVGRALAANPPTCVIKGNINDRGERIYHLPGWTTTVRS
ncbi:MAG TPA: hypothetical protein VJ890_16665 [Vineibacter sp.]|nr:hypothetical protein [Vineibacter sp.]